MIEIELDHLKKSGNEISQLLAEKLRADVSQKGSKLIVNEETNGPRFGIKDVKTQLKHVLHRLRLADEYRVLAEHHRIRIVKLAEKSKPPSERKGTAPSPSQSLPYFFP